MNKTTEPAAPDLSRIEPIDYVYRGSDGLIYRTVPQHVPVIETIPRYSAATVERLVQERDELKDVLFRVTEAMIIYHDDGSCVMPDQLADRCREALK